MTGGLTLVLPMRLRYLLFSAILLVGCRSVPPQLAVNVVDAETGRPVPGAIVRAGPESTEHTAGADGQVKLAVHREAGDAIVSVRATGYLGETADLRLPEVGDSTVPTLTVFAGPAPTLALTLPRGYRGPVVVTLDPTAAPVAGQRAFTAAVAADGKVTVAGPPVLAKLTVHDITAVRFDGSPLATDVPAGEVGFRWAKTGTNLFYFLVGTQAECDEYAKSLALPDPPRGNGGQGKGGGGGRRGGGGGGRRGGGGMGPGGP